MDSGVTLIPSPRDVAPRSAKSSPTVTAIIPLYNGKKFIEQSLRSILNQTRLPDEIVVVDDGSSDGGGEIARELAGHLPSFRLLRKSNGGQSSARNFGVENSASQLIALLDQDDVWYPRHIERLLRAFTRSKSDRLGWVYSNLDEIDASGNMVTRRFLPKDAHHPKASIFHCLDRDMFVLPSASLISRKAFEAVGGFDEKLIGYEDDDLFLRLFRAGYDNVFVDEPLSQWRIYSGSTSYSPVMGRSRALYAEKLAASFPDEPDHDRFWTRDLVAPRFIRNYLFDAYKGVRLNDRRRVEATVSPLKALSRFARWRTKMTLRLLILPALSQFWLLRLGHSLGLGRILRPLFRTVK